MDQIILFLSCIIELYIFFDFFHSFFEIKPIFNKRYSIVAVTLLMSIGYFIINSIHISILNMITFPVLLFVYSSILFSCTLKGKIIYIIFTCSIFWGCEFLFMILLGLPSFIMGKNSIINVSEMPWLIFTLKLLTYVICNIFKQCSKKSHHRLNKQIFLYYLCIPVASIGIMFLTYYSGIDFSINVRTKVMLCIYFAIMQLGNFFIFFMFQKYSEELYSNMQQKLLITKQNIKLDYFMQMQELHTKHNEFIHDAKHYLKTIGHLISEDKIKDAINIIHELNVELETNLTTVFSKNTVLNSILSEKKAIADKQNIAMDIYIEPYTTLGTISDMDLITILGNLLDNALEASFKCKTDPFVHVRIYMENQGNLCIIKISNNYHGNLKKIDDEYVSTKNESGIHGIGLKSVERTAGKYGGYVECYEDNGHFIAVTLLPVNG